MLFLPHQSRIQPKGKPKKSATASAASSNVKKRKRQPHQFRQRVHRGHVHRKLKELDDRLKNFEEDTREITYVFKRVRALSKRMDEVDDQIEKYAHNIQRLLKTSRNTEKALLTNGLLLEGDYLSRSSSSELDWQQGG